MRKWLSVFILGMLFVFPSLVSAQTEIHLASLDVQLWPEYDQPSMLVIHDFTLPPDTALPVSLTFRIPKEANLIAVAFLQNGSLITIPYKEPVQDGKWQAFALSVDAKTTYRFEYYQPLAIKGDARSFGYSWDSGYAVDVFSVRVLQPVDAVSLVTQPVLKPAVDADGLTYFSGAHFSLKSGEQYALNLKYNKSTDTLVVPQQGLQPSAPVDQNTTGRVTLTNYLPYILGGLGVLLIAGGFVYYWQTGRKTTNKPRRRKRVNVEEEAEEGSEAYCHQCGARAKPSDRFCRVCGARFRPES